jgi:cell division protein FtsB
MTKGPNDLEQQIEDLKKQKVYLQQQCKKAGVTIICQEKTIEALKNDIDRLTEERDNIQTMYESK